MTAVKTETIKIISAEILQASGVPKAEAEIIADTIKYAHTTGRHTHGMNRLPIYIRKINEGLMTASTDIDVIKTSPVVSVIDAGNGFGQVAAFKGMQCCIDKAKQYGTGIVGVRNSNNFGTAGYFGDMATQHGMIGIVMGNSAPAIAPPGGDKPIMGTNPICFAFPTPEDEAPIILDMATAVAARGKIRLAARNGEKIPLGWALDASGNPTDDPNEALKGSMIPIGNYKGFGLSLMIDIMAGMINGSAFGGTVKNLNHPTELSRYGHFIMALNPEFFMTEEEYNHNMAILLNNLRACGEKGSVTLPGEIEYGRISESLEYTEIKQTQVEDTNKLAAELGIGIRL